MAACLLSSFKRRLNPLSHSRHISILPSTHLFRVHCLTPQCSRAIPGGLVYAPPLASNSKCVINPAGFCEVRGSIHQKVRKRGPALSCARADGREIVTGLGRETSTDRSQPRHVETTFSRPAPGTPRSHTAVINMRKAPLFLRDTCDRPKLMTWASLISNDTPESRPSLRQTFSTGSNISAPAPLFLGPPSFAWSSSVTATFHIEALLRWLQVLPP